MIVKISFLVAFIMVLTASQAQEFSEFEVFTHISDDDSLPYRMLRPQNMDETTKYPLVVFLHGAGERGNDNAVHLKHIAPLFLNDSVRTNYPCFVMAPQCPENELWTYPDWYAETEAPMSTVIDLIDSLIENENIDTSRLYITGLSMGGYGTWYLLTRFPEKFAAAVPICGGGDPIRVSSFKDVPIWAFHGKKDDIVPVTETRNMIEALKSVGGSPAYTEYKKVKHDSWVNAYRESRLLRWMFHQRKVKY
jgi:predicted peptidase